MTTDSTISSEIDFERIRQPKVREFVSRNRLHEPDGFSRMLPSCSISSDDKNYHTHYKKFLIKKDIDTVWNTYVQIHPKEAWNGEMVSFGLQYCRQKSAVSYLDDDYQGMQKDQIIILNLNIFGLIKIAVAHEIAEVDEKNKMIKLIYMAGGASEGGQWITMKPTPEGYTEVHHKTLYRSNSLFRDKVLYPGLHSKAISEFHLNVKRKAEMG